MSGELRPSPESINEGRCSMEGCLEAPTRVFRVQTPDGKKGHVAFCHLHAMNWEKTGREMPKGPPV
jgi:hypothetical protein